MGLYKHKFSLMQQREQIRKTPLLLLLEHAQKVVTLR